MNTGMKVLKFGGTSVGSAQRMKDVARLITDGERKIVVLSAMSGTTNTLVEISDYLYKKNPEGANEIINRLEAKYRRHIDELYATPEYKQKGMDLIKSHFDYIRSYTKDLFTLFEEKVILAQGELISLNQTLFILKISSAPSWNFILMPIFTSLKDSFAAMPMGKLITCNGEEVIIQPHSSVLLSMLLRFKSGPTSMVCITMTRAS